MSNNKTNNSSRFNFFPFNRFGGFNGFNGRANTANKSKMNDIQGKKTYYVSGATTPLWSERGYKTFASAYVKNVIVNRAVGMVSQSCASVGNFVSKKNKAGEYKKVENHAVSRLLSQPSKNINGVQFLNNLVSNLLIAGNAYIYCLKNEAGDVVSLELIRPDRIAIIEDTFDDSHGYRYTIDGCVYDFFTDEELGACDILHIKLFNPLDDFYGLSKLESSHFSIEQHNECIKWNKSLLQNGARPSGAIVVNGNGALGNVLTSEQFDRLKTQIQEQITNANNAGKVMVLEGGLSWQDMSVSPRDMDFISTKDSAARDIALSVGVPPQMLGIKGDNTYNNMQEARLAFWEETVLPLLNNIYNDISVWLSRHTQEDIKISYDVDSVLALTEKRSTIWKNINNNSFLTDEEKRNALNV